MSAAAYRARSATELIDATFQLLRRNFPQYFTLAALWYVPMVLLPQLFMPGSLKPGSTVPGSPVPYANFGSGFFVGIGVWFVLFLILSAIFQTAMFYASSDAYLGRPVDIADVLRRAVRRAGAMAYGYFLQSVCVFVAFCLFIIPGFIVSLGLFTVPCVIALENVNGGAALSRAWGLSKGLKGHYFLTMLLVGVLCAVGELILSIIIAVFSGGLGHAPSVLAQTVSVLGTSALMPVFPLVITLLYYDSRIRKEGFDIELMAQQVGGSAAGATKPQPA